MTPEKPKFGRRRRAAKAPHEEQPFGGGINKPELQPPRTMNDVSEPGGLRPGESWHTRLHNIPASERALIEALTDFFYPTDFEDWWPTKNGEPMTWDEVIAEYCEHVEPDSKPYGEAPEET